MINAAELVGTHDILFVTIDSLRYDTAQRALGGGVTPELAKRLPNGVWEKRHSPGSFTYAAHHAFFAGFLPTPVTPGVHPRLFAVKFSGSETISENTCVFEKANIVEGLASRGYHTACIGGVGFFNLRSPLSAVLPSMFAERYWTEECGVTDPESTRHQVDEAKRILGRVGVDRRVFLFLNVSATHQPTCIFLPGTTQESTETQAAALAYADTQLGELFRIMESRAPVLCIVCSDHGTAYGEDGYHGHRLSHETVLTVPYTEFIMHQKHARTMTEA